MYQYSGYDFYHVYTAEKRLHNFGEQEPVGIN